MHIFKKYQFLSLQKNVAGTKTRIKRAVRRCHSMASDQGGPRKWFVNEMEVEELKMKKSGKRLYEREKNVVKSICMCSLVCLFASPYRSAAVTVRNWSFCKKWGCGGCQIRGRGECNEENTISS